MTGNGRQPKTAAPEPGTIPAGAVPPVSASGHGAEPAPRVDGAGISAPVAAEPGGPTDDTIKGGAEPGADLAAPPASVRTVRTFHGTPSDCPRAMMSGGGCPGHDEPASVEPPPFHAYHVAAGTAYTRACAVCLNGTEPAPVQTHETFIAAVRDIATARLASETERATIAKIKMVYGAGDGGYRGVTMFGSWCAPTAPSGPDAKPAPVVTVPLVEIAARGQESPLQLACTTIHELGHVLAGYGHGHNDVWRAACGRLGLRRALAAGQAYAEDDLDADVRAAVLALPLPTDGAPQNGRGSFGMGVNPFLSILRPRAPRPCPQGIGTKGGKSRGAGSGRLRRYACACAPGTDGARAVYVASDDWRATCDRCHTTFKRAQGAKRGRANMTTTAPGLSSPPEPPVASEPEPPSGGAA